MGIKPSIYAITVSKNYSDVLGILIEKNTRFFKKWFIVTQEDDLETISVIESFNNEKVKIVYYPLEPKKTNQDDCKILLKEASDYMVSVPDYLSHADRLKLKETGMVFDKGGAIRQIQKVFLPKEEILNDDLVLLIDSDIVLPDNFEDVVSENIIEENKIYVSKRKVYLFEDDFLKDTGRVDKTTKIGSGFFQLYKYGSYKFCKRTYNAGWVDWEFKNQFEKVVLLPNFEVSHLGETDLNWSGKSVDTFIKKNEIESFCEKNSIKTNLVNETAKKSAILNYIKRHKIETMDRPFGLPNFLLFGDEFSGVIEFYNILKKCNNISFYQSNNIFESFFGTLNNQNQAWNLGFLKGYLNKFPPLGNNHLWGDIIISDNSEKFNSTIQKRMELTFVEKLSLWREFPLPKFIFCYDDPVCRSFTHYKHFIENYPTNHDYGWVVPGGSFEQNIFCGETDDIEEDCFFIKNSINSTKITWLLNNLKMPLKNILFVKKSEILNDFNNLSKRIKDFLQMDLNMTLHSLDSDLDSCGEEYKMAEFTKKKLQSYFKNEIFTLEKYGVIDE